MTFAEAVAAFRAFLEGQGERRELLWVVPGDVAWRDGLLIRVRAEAEAESELVAYLAAERGSGFGLLAFAVLGERLCCCVQVPESAEHAGALWIVPPFVCRLRAELPVGREPRAAEWLLARPVGQLFDRLLLVAERFERIQPASAAGGNQTRGQAGAE